MASKTLTGAHSSYTLTSASYTLTNLGTIGSNAVGTGLTISGTADTVVNAGTIRGENYGVAASQGLSLTNQASGRISSGDGTAIYISGAPGSVTNAGTVIGEIQGIDLLAGGYVSNQGGGLIESYITYGIEIENGAGTFTNAGSITGFFAGIGLYDGGSVTNQGTGTISGQFKGVQIQNAPGTVLNSGLISGGAGTYGAGVYLVAGGTVTNLYGGTITGGYGIQIVGGAGTVINAGSIQGTIDAVQFAAGYANRLIVDPGASFTGTVTGGNTIGASTISTLELAYGATIGTLSGLGTQFIAFANITIDSGAYWQVYGSVGASVTLINSGTVTAPLTLGAGAVLTNASGGEIGGAGITYAVTGIGAGPATVVNAGSIAGTGGRGVGIFLSDGGSVANSATAALISGSFDAIIVKGAAGTVSNYGTITSTAAAGIALYKAGSVTNGADGTTAALISGNIDGVDINGAAGTVTNYGTIAGTLERGIYLFDGGVVVNSATTGLISGSFDAIVVKGAAGSVANDGKIISTAAAGIALYKGGSVTNGFGAATALISGDLDGVDINGAAGTVANDGGTIAGTHGAGAYLFDGGTVDNGAAAALISGSEFGIKVAAAPGTVTNSGTISGGTDAVLFGAGFANRLVIDPGAVFSGTVNGGNTIGATSISTLELASGTSIGTLSGFGTKFVDFSHIAVDSGATWDIADPIGTGITVTNAGSIDATLTLGAGVVLTNLVGGTVGGTGVVAGVTVIGAATVLNAGDIAGSTYGINLTAAGTVINQSSGTISGTFGVRVEGIAGAVTNAGTITGTTDAVLLSPGFANRLVLDPGAAFSGTADGGNTIGAAVASTLELASGASIGTLIGLGTVFVDFADVAVDAGARWDIASTIGAGITLINAGTLTTQVALGSGGVLTNVSGGTIAGPAVVSGVAGVGSGPATVVNAGLISGTGYGVSLGAGGIVTNQAGATISGTANDGVAISGGAGTVINAGVIADGTDAVSLAAGFANRVIFDPGAAFSGTVDGGNSIGATTASTLELASGAFTGVLSGLGTQFVDFSNVTIDSGAAWSVASAIGAGVTLTNSGSVGTTVTLDAGAVLTNTFGGLLGGAGNAFAVYGATDGPATVVNAGALSGASTGIFAAAGGFVTNQSTGFIIGGPLTGGEGGNSGTGVWITGGAGTVVNAGTIDGLTNSVRFAADYTNLLVVDPDAVFSGVIEGGNAIGDGAISTLELASGASAGALSGIGSRYLDFAAITVDSGATWLLTGSNDFASGVTLTDAGNLTAANLIGGLTATIEAGATLDVQGAISTGETIAFDGATGLLTLGSPGPVNGAVTGFVAGDTIDLAGVDPTSVHLSDDVLDFTAGGIPGSFDLMTGGGAVSAVTDNSGGALVSALCFCAGTRIMTPSGEVAVEALSAGDLVLTASGAAKPLVWIGTGQVMVARGRRSAATPVIVRKSALAQNVPNRDLHVTKGHSLLLDGVLIPVEFLVNHRSIQWDDHAREVTIYHLELATHDLLLANGAPAESYRDDGNRWLFQNGNTGWAQSPKPPCAPVLTGGAVVDAVWRRLLDRSGARPGLPLTMDADLYLRVDGQRINPRKQRNGFFVFGQLRAGAEIRVVSRSGSPAELGLARDPRSLGVAIRQIRLWQGPRLRVLDAADHALQDGFHDYEADNSFRWTDGDALLPAALFHGLDGGCDQELLLDGTARYPLLAEAA